MRIIGIRHRVKKTAEGEARPTQVVILENGKERKLELETETDELDFVLRRYPTSFRKVEPTEDISSVLAHHRKYRKVKEGETIPVDIHQSQLRKDGKTVEIADKIPVAFEGFTADDRVAMILGGSGDNLAFALARRGQKIGSGVYRIAPFLFKQEVDRDKATDADAELLANLLANNSTSFHEVGPRDLALIWLRECLHARVDAMKARIGCEQRMRQHLIGKTFCSLEGEFPEGDIEKQFDHAKANDKIYLALSEEESNREKELEKACTALDVYTTIFKPIEGCGPKIASRIIAGIIDIRRFVRPPDEQELSKLWLERAALEKSIGLDQKLALVATICPADANRYDRSVALRHLFTAEGNHSEEEMRMLDDIIEIHKERHQVRREALRKSKSALRAFCGVHITRSWICATCKKPFIATHGVCPKCKTACPASEGMDLFPRRRNGGVANWQGDCRQALFLLADQFNRRPKSVWGQRLLAAKAKYREKHPDVVVADRDLASLFRHLEVFFRKNGVRVPPADFAASIDGLYSWFRASVTELDDEAGTLATQLDSWRERWLADGHSDLEYDRIDHPLATEIITWERRIEKASVAGKTVQIFTVGHIHKMALWYTVGKFVEQWLFPQWLKLQGEPAKRTANGDGGEINAESTLASLAGDETASDHASEEDGAAA